jgi:ribosomal protein S27AE
MSFTGKINSGMNNLAKSMKTGADNCKLDGKIAEQEKQIKKLSKEIGNLVIVRLDEGDKMSPDIMERYKAILEARKVIEELEGEKVSTEKYLICPKCGAKTTLGMRYCGKCGADMSVEEE